jgi:hypothetical protein
MFYLPPPTIAPGPIIQLLGRDASGNLLPVTIGAGLQLVDGALSATGGSGRPQGKNLLTWTASHPVGQSYGYIINSSVIQNLAHLTDGFGGSNAITGPGTNGCTISGNNRVEILATFPAPVYLNQIGFYGGNRNGSNPPAQTANSAQSMQIYFDSNPFPIFSTALPIMQAPQFFELLANTNFNQSFSVLRFVFLSTAAANGVVTLMELGLYGEISS